MKTTTYLLYAVSSGVEHFVQSARQCSDLQAHRSKVLRWIAEMGIELHPKQTTLRIVENGVAIMEASLASPRVYWKNVQQNNGLHP